jgi:ABC-2 type transport system permease protein
MRSIRAYRVLTLAALRAETQYRANLIMQTIGGMAFQGIGFAFIGVVINRFGPIHGWTLREISLLYGMRLCAHALWTVPFSQIFQLETVVRNGEFDRFLTRPVNVFLQLLSRRVQLQSLGDLCGGIGLLVVAASIAPVAWSAELVGYLVLAVVGGALVEVSANLAVSSLTFRFTTIYSLRYLLDNLFNVFGGYPVSIFPAAARAALTYLLPLAFVAYLPATVLMAKPNELGIPAPVAWGAPGAGVVLFFCAYRLWMWQLRHYSSPGH